VALVLMTAVHFGFGGATTTVGLIFCYLFCFGLVGPNVIALALHPFTRNAGSASALIGSIQMVAGASASALVSYLHNGTAMPMIALMGCCAAISLLLLGGTQISHAGSA